VHEGKERELVPGQPKKKLDMGLLGQMRTKNSYFSPTLKQPRNHVDKQRGSRRREKIVKFQQVASV